MYLLEKGLITLINIWNYKTFKIRLISKRSNTIAINHGTLPRIMFRVYNRHYDFSSMCRDENTHPLSHSQSECFPTLKQPSCTYSQRSKAETKPERSMMSGKAGPPTQVASNYKKREFEPPGVTLFNFYFKKMNKNAINSNRNHVSFLVPEGITLLFIFLYVSLYERGIWVRKGRKKTTIDLTFQGRKW